MNRSNTTPRSFSIDQLHAALGDVGGPARPDYLSDIVAEASRMRQRPGWTFPERWLSTDVAVRRQGVPRTAVLSAALVLLALLAAAGVYIGSQLTRPVHLGIFEPIAGRIVIGNQDGIWGVDPASSDRAIKVTSVAGIPVEWSSDGTRLLIRKADGNLFVLHADGSGVQVTEQLSEYTDMRGSGSPSGATISPDGSRVVFANLTKREEGTFCHNGALFAVDADGGPAQLLWKSQAAADGGIVRDPTFSPDGTRIAFADGYCDSNHSVWVMNADGSDAHQIVSSDVGPLGATHVHGLAWSAAGDEIALAVDDGTYTFATDGSGITQGAASDFCWPGREC